jgi:hypothetical protein
MNDRGALNDQELQSAFETCTLPRDAWIHRAHVRMAFLYSQQHPFSEALDRMRTSIKAYNLSQQIPESPDRGYHETITVVFMRLVHDALLRNGPFPTSDSFCDHHPELLDKSVLRKFYSRERLMSPEAKQGFIEPDLAELPGGAP